MKSHLPWVRLLPCASRAMRMRSNMIDALLLDVVSAASDTVLQTL